MCKEYNGYSNYQTWNVALWIDNDQGLHEACQVRYNLYSDFNDFANWLKDYFTDEANPLADQANPFTDLLGHALANVDWREVAEAVTAN